MKGIRQVRREAKRFFRLCVVDQRLDEERARLVAQRIVQSGRRGSLMLLSRFLYLVRLDRARHTAEIESAMPLREDLQAGIQSELAKIYGPGISAHFAPNSELIGGIRIRVGSDVYDGSVRGALKQLESTF